MESSQDLIFLPNKSKSEIGAVTYLVTAHFDENKEGLKNKIELLLKSEINRMIDTKSAGRSQIK